LSWLLKIVLVNLNYQIGVRMNFVQSRIPALFCSLQSEYGCHQALSYGAQRGNANPNSNVFRLIKYMRYKPKKYFGAKSTKVPQGTNPTSAFSQTQTCISPFVIIYNNQ